MARRIKHVLVFGKTGSGKSTIANMLLKGSVTGPFRTGDTAAAVTVNCETKSNCDFSVTDTVGFGEAADPERAGDLLLQYMEKVGEVAYSHVLFVARAGRIDNMDRLLWETFLKIFKGTECAFLVVFTNKSDTDWLARNRKELEETYKECPFHRFIAVDFPSIGDSEIYCQQRREESRLRLNAAIDGIFQQNEYQYYRPEYSVDSDAEEDGHQTDSPWIEGSRPTEFDPGKCSTPCQAPQESRPRESAKEHGSRSPNSVHSPGFSDESGRRDDGKQRREELPSRLNAAIDGIFQQKEHRYYIPEYSVDSHAETDVDQFDWPWLAGSPPREFDKGKILSPGQALQLSRPKDSAKEHGSQSPNSVHRAGFSEGSGCRDDGNQRKQELRSMLNPVIDGIFQQNEYQYYISEYSVDSNARTDGDQSDWPWLEGSRPMDFEKGKILTPGQALQESSPKESAKEHGSQSPNSVHKAGFSEEYECTDDGQHRNPWTAPCLGDKARTPMSQTEYRSSPWELHNANRRVVEHSREGQNRIKAYKRGYSENQKAKMKAIVKDIAKGAFRFGITLMHLVSFFGGGPGTILAVLPDLINLALS